MRRVALLVAVVALGATACGRPTPRVEPPPRPTTSSTTTTATTVPCTSPATWPLGRQLEQLLMVSGQFADLAASAPEATAGVGALVLFGQPAALDRPRITADIGSLVVDAAQAGQVTPWMATDEEGGTVARLSGLAGSLPSARQMGATLTPAQITDTVEHHALTLSQLGITMDLAPVLDTAPASDAVADEADRSFSDQSAVVATDGIAFAEGLRRAGVVAVGKHFPGLGHASADTDLGPALDPPLGTLQGDDLLPFAQAVAAGVPVVMVGHPVVPGLTNGLPASLSAAAYDLLRSQLGFGGVALTDSLGAGAVSAAGYSESAAATTALEAGADMVLVGSDSWQATMAALGAAASKGALSEARIVEADGRVLAAKGFSVCTDTPGT